MENATTCEASGRPPGPGVRRYGLWAVVLIGFAALACLGRLGSGPRLSDHESINALGARQTLESGDWLIPRVGEIARVRKPPLGIWSIAAASWLVDRPGIGRPVTDLSARLPAATAGVLNALVVWWLGTMLFGRRAGLVAGCIMAGCAATLFFARNAQVDMLLTLLTTASAACFWRGAMQERPSPVFMMLFYAALAAAMMAKAPLPMVTVGLALAVYWFVTVPLVAAGEQADGHFVARALTQLRAQVLRLGRLWLIPGLVLFVVLAGAWPWYVYRHVPNAVSLWKIEYLSRYSGEVGGRADPFYYYIPMAFALAVPFMLSLPEALAAVFLNRYRAQQAGLAFALTWAIVGTVFLSTASFKRPHYLLSVMPAYCLLLAPVIDRLFFGALAARGRTVKLACAAVPIGLAIGFTIGARMIQEQYAPLLRMYVAAACLLGSVWTLAALCFAAGRRGAAFALLNSWVLVVVLLAWPAIGRHLGGDPALNDLVERMRRAGIPTDASIYWVEGRPNSAIEFYAGYRPRRLIDELEMAGLRPDRSRVDADLMRAVARRIEKQLARPEPVYLIMKIGSYELLDRETPVRGRVLIEQKGYKAYPGDEWAVITQPGPGSRAATRAGH